MSKKKVRAGHRGFLTGVLPDVDECLNSYEAEKKVELAKWYTVLKEQLDKILPLDEEIYAELIADEKSTEEDITAEIDRAAKLKADVLQRLAAIDEKLTVLQPGWRESQNMSGSPSSPYQNVVENGATSSSANSKTVRVKLPKLEVRTPLRWLKQIKRTVSFDVTTRFNAIHNILRCTILTYSTVVTQRST